MIDVRKKLTASLLAVLLLAGCGEPTWQFPGGALSGEEKPFDLSVLAPEGGVIQLETNPVDPYSVNVGYLVIGGNMYVCLLYTSPSPRDATLSRMPSSA